MAESLAFHIAQSRAESHRPPSSRPAENWLRITRQLRIIRWMLIIRRVWHRYNHQVGRPLHLFRPHRFTEKMQWRKLFDLDPIHAVFCDKIATREYVARRLGSDTFVPMLRLGPYGLRCNARAMFNGVARLVLLRANYGDLGHERSQAYYDMQWRSLPLRALDVPCSTNPVPRPPELRAVPSCTVFSRSA
jgi:hypothetical protein